MKLFSSTAHKTVVSIAFALCLVSCNKEPSETNDPAPELVNVTANLDKIYFDAGDAGGNAVTLSSCDIVGTALQTGEKFDFDMKGVFDDYGAVMTFSTTNFTSDSTVEATTTAPLDNYALTGLNQNASVKVTFVQDVEKFAKGSEITFFVTDQTRATLMSEEYKIKQFRDSDTGLSMVKNYISRAIDQNNPYNAVIRPK